MAREVMRRQAADNEYLHQDFHGALSCGIDYLEAHFGADAVRQYLRSFSLSYYAPLRDEVRRRGLAALRDHYDEVYRLEGGQVQFELTDDELRVRVEACPAVTHMRQRGYPVARLWVETLATVGVALCEDTPYEAALLEYEPQTGRSLQRFRRRSGS